MFLKDQFKLLTICSIPSSVISIFRKRVHLVIIKILTIFVMVFSVV